MLLIIPLRRSAIVPEAFKSLKPLEKDPVDTKNSA